jgi:hypothetical protein
MYEIEEKLLKDGFTDTDQSQTDAKDFADQGWPNVKYTYKVEAVEMPSFDQLTALASGHGSGAGSAMPQGSGFGSGFGSSDPLSGFQNSALGGMLNMMGAFGGKKDVLGAQGGALIQTQYTLFQQILKVSVRKVTLKVTYQVLGSDRDLTFVAFFTDAAAMDKVLNGMGAMDLGDDSGGAGSGAGSGTGSGKTPSRGGGSGAGSGK